MTWFFNEYVYIDFTNAYKYTLMKSIDLNKAWPIPSKQTPSPKPYATVKTTAFFELVNSIDSQ